MATIQDGSMTLTSTSQDEAQMRESISVPVPEPEPEQAALPVDEPVEPKPVEDPAIKKAKRKDPEARIAAITREKYDSIREAAEAKTEAARLKAELDALRAPKPAAPAQTAAPVAGRPSVDQFQTYDDYVEALTDWKLEQRAKTAQEHDQQRERFSVISAQSKTFQERVAPLVAADPTLFGGETPRIHPYLQNLKPINTLIVEGKLQEATVQNAIAQHVINAEDPVALMLHFSDHPDEFQRLSTLYANDAIGLAREMGRLEARLSAPSASDSVRPSKAKPPIRPVGSSPVAHAPDADDEQEQRFQAEKRRRRVGVR